MPEVITQLELSAVEVENPAGSSTIVAAAFEYGGAQGAALMPVAAGSRQKFDRFSRLTLTAPQGAARLVLSNASPSLVLDVYRESRTDRVLLGVVGVGQSWSGPLGRDEQLFVMPRLEIYIPPPPRIVEARYHRENLLTSTDNYVSLGWIFPPEHLGRIVGYHLYRAVYRGGAPIDWRRLTAQPQVQNGCNIMDFLVTGKDSHRYAVTAVGLNGVESLFSNVLILDSSSLWGLKDAGSIAL